MGREEELLPEPLARRVKELAARLGRRIILRPRRWPDRRLRGRLQRLPGALVIEYRDDVAGYFWHYDIVSELLDYAEQGILEVEVRDADRRQLEDAGPPVAD